MNTIDLRRAARLTSKASDSEFARAFDMLQADFKILPVAVAEAGAWRYAFIYDIVPRHMPELVERARSIGEAEARSRLAQLYFTIYWRSAAPGFTSFVWLDRRPDHPRDSIN